MTHYDWIADAVYIGCFAPLALVGVRVLVLFGWSLLKKWGTG